VVIGGLQMMSSENDMLHSKKRLLDQVELLQQNAALARLFPVWIRVVAWSSRLKWKHVFTKTKYL